MEAGATAEVFAAPAAPLHAAPAGRRAARRARRRRRPTRRWSSTARDVKVRFPIRGGLLRRTVGHVKAVDGVSLTVREGQTVGVVGESGSGKTTLGLALLRLQASRGRDPLRRPRHPGPSARARCGRCAGEMQIVFQDPYGSLSPRMSVGADRRRGPGRARHRRRRRAERARPRRPGAGARSGSIPRCRDRYPHEFSGGQRQRIAIARAMVLKPAAGRARRADLARSTCRCRRRWSICCATLQARHRLAYLFISHDLRVVRAMSARDHRDAGRPGGRAGPDRADLRAPEQPYTRALMAAAFDLQALEEGGART